MTSPRTARTDAVERELLDRVHPLVADRELREVRMFGVRALMVDGSMLVAAHRDGSLLVHVDPADDTALLAAPGASRPEMGTGRSMGVGWIRVDAEALHDDDALDSWVAAALRRQATPG